MGINFSVKSLLAQRKYFLLCFFGKLFSPLQKTALRLQKSCFFLGYGACRLLAPMPETGAVILFALSLSTQGIRPPRGRANRLYRPRPLPPPRHPPPRT